jgi:hypothetical protein
MEIKKKINTQKGNKTFKRNGENTTQKGENTTQNGENTTQNGENTTQNGENTTQNKSLYCDSKISEKTLNFLSFLQTLYFTPY